MSAVHAFGPEGGGRGAALCGYPAPKLQTWITAKVTCKRCRRALSDGAPTLVAFQRAKQPALPGLESAVSKVMGRPRRAPWAPNPNAAHPQDRDAWCRDCEAHFNAGHPACLACDMTFRPPSLEVGS